MLGLRVVSGNRSALEAIAHDAGGSIWAPAQRAQARLAIHDLPGALRAYAEDPPDPRGAINDLVNDEWVWRLPHVVNYAHLRSLVGDEAERLFSMLMGEAVEPRREFIEQHAQYVRNLDV